MGQLIKKMTALHPHKVEVKFEGSTAGDIPGIYSDPEHAAKALGYFPKVGLEKGLAKMYAWASLAMAQEK